MFAPYAALIAICIVAEIPAIWFVLFGRDVLDVVEHAVMAFCAIILFIVMGQLIVAPCVTRLRDVRAGILYLSSLCICVCIIAECVVVDIAQVSLGDPRAALVLAALIFIVIFFLLLSARRFAQIRRESVARGPDAV